MVRQVSLYGQLVEITEDYLGPAAQNFIDRQISNHLDKDPSKITKNDLKKLNEWLRISVALLSDDDEIIDGFSAKLKLLYINGSKSTEIANNYT
jgi:hypothetical protein